MMSIASLMGSALAPAQNRTGYHDSAVLSPKTASGATRVRILHRSVGTLVGPVIACGVTLHFTYAPKALRWRSCWYSTLALSDYS